MSGSDFHGRVMHPWAWLSTDSYTCRGFAFVEFFTKQEAKAAAEAITGVHLYGRRLVVEFAKADEGLDELRSKAAIQMQK